MFKCRKCDATFSKPDVGILEGVCPECGHMFYDELPKVKKINRNDVIKILHAYFQVVEEEQPSANMEIEDLAPLVLKKLE